MIGIREMCKEDDLNDDYIEVIKRESGFSFTTKEEGEYSEVVLTNKQAIRIAEFIKNDTES